jgi:hypothetical protein
MNIHQERIFGDGGVSGSGNEEKKKEELANGSLCSFL